MKKTKTFSFDFAKDFKDFNGALCYRFMFRLKGKDGKASKAVSVRYLVGAPAEIQAFAEQLANDDRVLNAACEYQYSVDLSHLSEVVPIKSEDDLAEEE